MDALTLEGLETVVDMIGQTQGPICTLDAGLMIYLTEQQFGEYVAAGRRLLDLREGSSWVATDMCLRTREFVEKMVQFDPSMGGYFERIKEKLGVDHTKFFKDAKEQTDFLESNGLAVRRYNRGELGYEFNFADLNNGVMSPQRRQEYLDYLEDYFKTLVIKKA